MSGVLVVAECSDGRVRDTTFEMVAAGATLGPVSLVVLAPDPELVVGNDVPEGVVDVLAVTVPSAAFDADVWRAALEQVISARSPDVVVGAWSVDAMSYGPAVAAATGLALATDVIALRDGGGGRLVVERSLYGGKVEAELELDGPALILVRPGVIPASDRASEAPPVTHVDASAATSRTRHRELLAQHLDGGVDITQARFVLAIGRGVGERENVPVFESLAERMGATFAVSRPLVDAGWVSAARQVGQSGSVVKPAVYLALGISGAIQHLAGMRESETVIAVNTDPEAAIFGVATFGAVADIFDVAEEIEKLY